MRGIVISPLQITGRNSFSAGGLIEGRLRNYILYWDKIDIPQNNLIAFGDSPEIEFLKSAGVVQQSRLNISMNGEMTKLYMLGQMRVFEENNKRDKGKWSLGQENISLVLPEEFSAKGRCIELDLYNRLPVPTAEVSLHDILLYKDKRQDELMAFRALMDEFYSTIINSSDSERAVEVATNKVIMSLAAIDKTMNESKISRLAKGLKVSLDFTGALKGMGIGGLIGNEMTTDVALGAALGGLTNLLKVEVNDVMKPREIPENLNDYAYLYYANQGYRI